MKKPPAAEFHHESLEDPTTVTAFLEELRKGFAHGSLHLRDGSGHIELRPDRVVHFALDASARTDRVRLTVTLSWRPADAEDDEAGPLVIESGPAPGAVDPSTPEG